MKLCLIIYSEAADEYVIAELKKSGNSDVYEDGGSPRRGGEHQPQVGDPRLAREEQCPFHGRGR